MTRIPEYERGFRDGARRAVSLLHALAGKEEDPSLRKALHTAALEIGTGMASWQMRSEIRGRARLDSDMICTRQPVPRWNAWDD